MLLYNHGQVQPHDKIEHLGRRLFNLLLEHRKYDRRRRPIFFLCHSTGGLVAKACLALAQRADPDQTIVASCYGIAFFATPHQGSSYLSADEYAQTIHRLLHLEYEIPRTLRDQLRPRQEQLWHLSNQFKALSADMKVWSFLETVDSTLHARDLESGNTMEFHAPITSIRSGLLGIEHENEIPMATDHVGTASFEGQSSTLDRFLAGLNEAVNAAVDLSLHVDTTLDVEREVIIQINGFFEDTALGVSDETPLKLWSTRVSLEDYLHRGPSACLRERLNRVQPGGLDDSSLSSFDTHFFSHVVPGPDNQDEQSKRDCHSEKPCMKPPRPAVSHSHSYMEQGHQSPVIHITEAARDGYFDSPSSGSPPSPTDADRRHSINKVLGLIPLQSHKRSASNSSSHTSGSRPPS